MRFRFHRGSLEESLKTTVIINSIQDLSEKLNFPKKIEFEYVGMDKRCNWNTYYVISDDHIVGMSDGKTFA